MYQLHTSDLNWVEVSFILKTTNGFMELKR
jgi:hypothetical protein